MALAITVVVAACGGGDDEPAVEPKPAFGKQPNIIFVLTDDQNLDQFTRATMPYTHEYLDDNGTTFNLHRATTPLCCPSRASMLTGQYGHNNGVLSNVPGWSLLEDPENILPIWLQRVGYETSYIGKYLNGYEKSVETHEIPPPGWDNYYGLIGSHGYYDFKVTDNGNKKRRTDGETYLTDDLNREAVKQVRQLSGDDPFYLQVSQLAPHVENFIAESDGPCGAQAVPAPHDLNRFRDDGLPDSPSINERDVSDKPPFVTGKEPLTAEQLDLLETRYECRLGSLRAVDQGVRDLIRALAVKDELKQTVFIFGSDNGTFHGEHRLPGGKGLAYQEASRIPFVVKAPQEFRGGAERVDEVDLPTANIDVVPTILDYAGGPPCDEDGCRVMDGRSLVPLISGDPGAYPKHRAIATELTLNADAVDVGRGISCEFSGVFQGNWAYIHHYRIPDPVLGACVEEDVIEQYNLKRDPYELINVASPATPTDKAAERAAKRLEALTVELSDCAGIKGRDPEPESGNYCR